MLTDGNVTKNVNTGTASQLAIVNRHRVFTITGTPCVKSLVIEYGLKEDSEVSTPMTANICDEVMNHKVDKIFDAHLYQAIIRSLQHLAKRCRPDISLSVSVSAKFSKMPNKFLFNAAKRIVRYLKGSSNYGLQLSCKSEVNLISTSCSDYAVEKRARQSGTGCIIKSYGSLVAWSSSKKRVQRTKLQNPSAFI